MEKQHYIERILSQDSLEQDEKWWEIYTSSFPITELEPKQALFNCLNQKAGLSLRVRHKKTHETIGLAHGQFLESFKALMLIYLAVDKSYRSQRLGSTLLEFVEVEVNKHYGENHHHGIIFEVDRPETFTTPEKRLIAKRRISFYKKLGYTIVDIDYHQPPLKSDHTSLPMYLMMKTNHLSTQEKKQLVHAIYFEKYSEIYGISHVKQSDISATWKKISQLNNW